MSQHQKLSRRLITVLVLLAIGGALAFAFWPRPLLVDLALVSRGDLTVTIDDEGNTRVRESFVVSTPVAGRLQRVQAHSGDVVKKGETIVAEMRPTNPEALDARTREQARAIVDAAEAALRAARADLNAAVAVEELARNDLERTKKLTESGIASLAALERAQSSARAGTANLEMAAAAISMREAELASARARLISFDDTGLAAAIENNMAEVIPLKAPIDGRILRILQESETTLPAGAPIMEIGNIADDLEVVIDLISSDAVKVNVGDPVLFENWGGEAALHGEISRIDPFGVTKFSALGVEEQRVGVVARLLSPPDDREGLGHGYSLKARIVVWQAADILIVPASALFRSGDGWALFRVTDGVARMTLVEIGQSDGISSQVLSGLRSGDQVVVYPSAELVDGASVSQRQFN